MKKFVVILAILVALTIVAGCASGGGGGGGGDSGTAPYIVDLSLFPYVKNAKAFTKDWDDCYIPFPEFPGFDFANYTRVTITAKFYDASGTEVAPADSLCIVSLINDVEGDWRGPAMGPGPNTPLKEFNVGGYSGTIHTDRGSRVRLTRQPGAVLFQNNDMTIRYVEITSLVFHNGNYSTK